MGLFFKRDMEIFSPLLTTRIRGISQVRLHSCNYLNIKHKNKYSNLKENFKDKQSWSNLTQNKKFQIPINFKRKNISSDGTNLHREFSNLKYRKQFNIRFWWKLPHVANITTLTELFQASSYVIFKDNYGLLLLQHQKEPTRWHDIGHLYY
jgi:hypothetical protein